MVTVSVSTMSYIKLQVQMWKKKKQEEEESVKKKKKYGQLWNKKNKIKLMVKNKLDGR